MGTQCVPSVATCVAAKIYCTDPFFICGININNGLMDGTVPVLTSAWMDHYNEKTHEKWLMGFSISPTIRF